MTARVTEYVPGSLTELELEFSLSRDAFNRRCIDIVDQSLKTCEDAMQTARLPRDEIERRAFKLHFADNIENFTTFDVGTLLASDEGVEYKVEVEGEAIIFPNPKVAIGQRAMLMVKPVSVAGKVS